MSKKNIYIAGCGGMLGEAIYEIFKTDYNLNCTDKDVNTEWLSYLDFTDFSEYEKQVVEFNTDYLFHIGAFTDLEYCELHEEETYMNNTLAVENAVRIANKLNIPIIYISTAGIFGGEKEIYDDFDMPNPLDVYARSKYMGERYVVENANRYIVFRAGWMMGGGLNKDKKFIGKLIRQIINGKTELFVVNDKKGTPTYTFDFAKTLKSVLEREMWGLYNCACGGETCRLDVAKQLVSCLKLENKIKITEVTSDYFKNEYFAPRPDCERLENKKLNILRLNKMRDWKDALEEYIQKDYDFLLNNKI